MQPTETNPKRRLTAQEIGEAKAEIRECREAQKEWVAYNAWTNKLILKVQTAIVFIAAALALALVYWMSEPRGSTPESATPQVQESPEARSKR
ncbi:hypothetical protein [uncultured Marinobacter sp.]|uniref:hypothetical protein n=1 Tax=uncultured Marinobacter sp. TaxID=187379 RepID=UPI002584ED2B|nr:hypothetical protein [uncultured Marinobacter sp.]